MVAAFICLITCAIASHWAVWRRLAEAEAKLTELKSETTRDMDGLFDLAKRVDRGLDLQQKQIAGLQTWANRVIRREDEQGPPRPADPETYQVRTYPKGPNEV